MSFTLARILTSARIAASPATTPYESTVTRGASKPTQLMFVHVAAAAAAAAAGEPLSSAKGRRQTRSAEQPRPSERAW